MLANRSFTRSCQNGRVNSLPLRRLMTREGAAPDRIAYFNTWYRDHNNPRYTELLPRIERLDPYLLTFPGPLLPRAAATIAWRHTRARVEPAVLRAVSQRYRHAFVTETNHLEHLTIPVVADVDDPRFDEREVRLLAGDNVAAYIVTAETAARRFEELGVARPWHVVPQGVDLSDLDLEAAAVERARRGGPVAGYIAAFLLLPEDRGGGNPLYDVSHLLEVWDQVRAQVPAAKLELIGRPSDSLRGRVRGRDDVILTGSIPQDRILPRIAAFDVALYPRAADQGIRSVKVAEYLGAGLPIVSYDYRVVDDVREAGAGLLVKSPNEFAEALAWLLTDEIERRRLGVAARVAGRERDWGVLSERYAALLDEYLPPR
jgi:glycosyltransferase involved in cell wall biosynthesis